MCMLSLSAAPKARRHLRESLKFALSCQLTMLSLGGGICAVFGDMIGA